MSAYSKRQKTIVSLSLTLVTLISFASIVAITTTGFYNKETVNWQIQALAQDYFDLLVVVPLLLIAVVFILRENKIGKWLWGGITLYLIYTFVIYCFDTHFNSLFIVYCSILGISFYSLVIFSFQEFSGTQLRDKKPLPSMKVLGIYFIATSLLFAFLWLSEDVPAVMHNRLPASVVEAGLPTNPVHVLDLAILLPGIFFTGILVLRRKRTGWVLTPLLLVFFVLMSLSIAGIICAMIFKGLESSSTVAFVMFFLAVFSTILLIWHAKKLQ